jgi:hypothetical protein
MASGYELDGVRFPSWVRRMFSIAFRLAVGSTHPLIQEVAVAVSQVVEVKNGGAIPPFPPYTFMAWCSIHKYRETFTLEFKPIQFIIRDAAIAHSL